MTPALYFLHLKTLDIRLLIVNISVADDAFYKKYCCNLKIKFNMKDRFKLFFVVVKMTERWKNQSDVWTYFTQLFIYFITTVNKYRFCISLSGT